MQKLRSLRGRCRIPARCQRSSWGCESASLFILFAEPRVGEVRAGELEENSRSPGNGRQAPSPPTGTAAGAADTPCSPVGDLAATATTQARTWTITQPPGHFRWSLRVFTEHTWPAAKRVHRDVHTQCCKDAQLLHNHIFITHGAREPDHRCLG